MPLHLSILFRARPPLDYAEPIEKGKCKPLRGLNDNIRDYMATFEEGEPPKPKPLEKAGEKKERIRKEKLVEHLVAQKEEVKKWNPYNDLTIKGDPYRTLFVSNLSYQTDEKTLKESLQIYGRIRRVRIVVDQKTGRPRGYAFVEFESESDFQNALERTNGRKVDGRRIVVDYERGRTKQEWIPRRLGGGKGDKRRDRDTERIIRDLKKTDPLLAERSRSRTPPRDNGASKKPTEVAVKEEDKKVESITPTQTGEEQKKPETSVVKSESESQVKKESHHRSDHRSRSRSHDRRADKHYRNSSRDRDGGRHHHRSHRDRDYSRSPGRKDSSRKDSRSRKESRKDSKKDSKKESKKESRKDSKKEDKRHHDEKSVSKEANAVVKEPVAVAVKEEGEAEPGEIQ